MASPRYATAGHVLGRAYTPPPRGAASTADRLWRLERASRPLPSAEYDENWVSSRRAFATPPKGRGVGEYIEGPPEDAYAFPSSVSRQDFAKKSDGDESINPSSPSEHIEGTEQLVNWLDRLRATSGWMAADAHVQLCRIVKEQLLDFDTFEKALTSDVTIRSYVTTKNREMVLRAFRHYMSSAEERKFDVLQKIATNLSIRFKDTYSIVKKLGGGGNGTVSKENLSTFFFQIGCIDNVDDFFQILRKDRRGHAYVGEIVHILGPYIRPSGTCAHGPKVKYQGDPGKGHLPPEVMDAMGKLAEKAQVRCKDLRSLFLLLDRDRVGYATREAFQGIFKYFNLSSRLGDIVFDFLDDGDGQASYIEVLNAFGSYLDVNWQPKEEGTPPREFELPDDVQDACARIGTKAAQKYKTVQKMFVSMNSGRKTDLKVSRMEFQRWVADLGNLSRSVADCVFNFMDPHKKGEVSFHAIAYTLGPFIVPGVYGEAAVWSEPLRTRAPTKFPEGVQKFDPYTEKKLMEFGYRLAKTHTTFNDVFRGLKLLTKTRTGNEEGGINRRAFVRFCVDRDMPADAATKLYDYMDVDGDESLSVKEVRDVLGFFINIFWSPVGNATYATRQKEDEMRERVAHGATPQHSNRGSTSEKDSAIEAMRTFDAASDRSPRSSGRSSRNNLNNVQNTEATPRPLSARRSASRSGAEPEQSREPDRYERPASVISSIRSGSSRSRSKTPPLGY